MAVWREDAKRIQVMEMVVSSWCRGRLNASHFHTLGAKAQAVAARVCIYASRSSARSPGAVLSTDLADRPGYQRMPETPMGFLSSIGAGGDML